MRETRRVLGTSAAAEDAAQDAVLRAWRHRNACAAPDRPGPWVAAIARREALREAGRRREAALDVTAGAVSDPCDADVAMRIDVTRALAPLEIVDRQLLAARYWDDLTQPEAAKRLGIPEGTAKVRLHRLRKKLATALRDQ